MNTKLFSTAVILFLGATISAQNNTKVDGKHLQKLYGKYEKDLEPV